MLPKVIPLLALFFLFVFAPGSAAAQGTTSDIPALILQLADRTTEWAAASRLQKLGDPAIVALVANMRQDGITDQHHGTHSPTMRTLAKIGEPAVAEIARALTLASRSSTAEDLRYAQMAIYTLSRIGGARAATVLINVARSASVERTRGVAFSGLAWDASDYDHRWPWRPWEFCFIKADPRWCPLDAEAQSVAAAVRPFLADLRDSMAQESNANLRIATAHVVAFWGEGEAKAAAEQIINAGYASGTLFTKRTEILALFNRGDAGYVPLAANLLMIPTGSPPYLSEDGKSKAWAIQFAVRSHNIAFVPTLIDMLSSSDLNGNTTTSSRAGVITETRHTFAEDALAALRLLSFQDFGSDPQRWREWWAANSSSDWRTLLTRHVQGLLPQLATAEPAVMLEWMNGLLEADDPAVLPFVTAIMRHPRLNMFSYSPDSRRVGEGVPGSLRLLLNLVSQGSGEARDLIHECSATINLPLAIECSRVVVWLGDRQKGLDRLNVLMAQSHRWRIAETLAEFGDKRGIPVLIDLLTTGSSAEHNLAYRALRRFTQEDIPDDAAAWQQWWRGAENSFTVKTKAALIDELFQYR